MSRRITIDLNRNVYGRFDRDVPAPAVNDTFALDVLARGSEKEKPNQFFPRFARQHANIEQPVICSRVWNHGKPGAVLGQISDERQCALRGKISSPSRTTRSR